jgi:hypothetical protein
MPNLECVPGQIEPEKRDAKSSCAIVSPLGAISETGFGFLSWRQQFLPSILTSRYYREDVPIFAVTIVIHISDPEITAIPRMRRSPLIC